MGESKKGQLYANVIIEWPVITLYYKMRQELLQKATAILLQNVAEVY